MADSDDTAPPRNGGNQGQAGFDWRPRPDPTILTTAALRDAIGNLRELLETRLDGMDRATELQAGRLTQLTADTDGQHQQLRTERASQLLSLRELIESRLNSMDKATELLAESVAGVPSDTDKQVMALRELLSARIDGMDVATKVLADSVEKFPSDIDRAAANVREFVLSQVRLVESVAGEKFTAIEGTFASNALALTAALAAQKEAAAEQNKSNTLAITKSELSTKETISANAAQTQTGFNSLSATVADIKDRVVRIESMGVGAATSDAGQRQDRAQLTSTAVAAIMSISVILAVAAIIVSIALHK